MLITAMPKIAAVASDLILHVNSEAAVAIYLIASSNVRLPCLLILYFILLHTSSIGFSSGQYFGNKRNDTPAKLRYLRKVEDL